MPSAFKPLERRTDFEFGAAVSEQYEKKQQNVVWGLEDGANILPVGVAQTIESIRAVPLHFPNTCFIADVLACSTVPTDRLPQEEARLKLLLEAQQQINLNGVFTAGNIPELSTFFEQQVGVSLEALPEQLASAFELGQRIVSLIQEKRPLLICYETQANARAGHWVILKGVRRLDEHTTRWIVIDPNSCVPANTREIETAELARYVIGNHAFQPQLVVANRQENPAFRPIARTGGKSAPNPAFRPLNS